MWVSRLCKKSLQLFQDPSRGRISCHCGFPLCSRTSALAIPTLSQFFVIPGLSFLTTGLHLSVEPSDCADGSLICAVTVELHHPPHPGREGSPGEQECVLDALSLQPPLPHSTSLFAVDAGSGAKPGEGWAAPGACVVRSPACSCHVPQLQ